MEFFEALPLVVGSYLAFGAVRRRVQLVVGRTRGAKAAAFRTYHHRALLEELPHRGPAEARGAPVIPPPISPRFGPMPSPWVESGWFLEDPGPLRQARDLLLAGVPERAAEVAAEAGGQEGETEAVFVWAAVCRIWAGQLEAADEIARVSRSLPGAGREARRLQAWIEALRAEEGRGPDAQEAADRALAHLDTARPTLDDSPAWAGLPVHLAILRLASWRLEWDLHDVRRRWRRAKRRHAGAPPLLFCEAYLAISMGDAAGAAELLAKALYHGRGDPHFARAILAVRGIQWSHPTLFTRASAAAHTRDVDTPGGAALQSGPPHRGPSA